jgi:hypothetical protein
MARSFFRKKFVHEAVFNDSTKNIDFLLSLPADLVYYVAQLWRSRNIGNAEQWIYMLSEIEKLTPFSPWYLIRKREIRSVRAKWCKLLKEYNIDLKDIPCPNGSRRHVLKPTVIVLIILGLLVIVFWGVQALI